jgi:hypothetical protein
MKSAGGRAETRPVLSAEIGVNDLILSALHTSVAAWPLLAVASFNDF